MNLASATRGPPLLKLLNLLKPSTRGREQQQHSPKTKMRDPSLRSLMLLKPLIRPRLISGVAPKV
jgi:hypothetical protein